MKKIPWWFTEIGELERQKVMSAFDNKRFSLGPVGQELEAAIGAAFQVPYVLVTPSGSAALTMALLAVGIKPGDEVIVPDLTWIATAQAAAILGARVVPVDCRPDVPLLDPVQVRKKMTPKTKAIIPVHLNGRACAMDELSRIAAEHQVPIIEDACKAMASRSGAGYLGTLGTAGCFSLGMISLVSAGYGGFVVTRDENLYRKLKLIRDHGVQRQGEERYERLGFNFKFSDILAAIGVAQFSRIPEKQKHLREIYRRYARGLASLPYLKIIPVDVDKGEVPLLVEVCSPERERIIACLKDQGVETQRLHRPVHAANYGGQETFQDEDFPHASRFSREGFILPCGPSQPLENVDRCLEILQSCPVGVVPSSVGKPIHKG